MKRIINLFMILCLLAGCSLAGAENLHFEGKPWINSCFYGLWPSEQPAVEDSFELYANYDTYRNALEKGEKRDYAPLFEAQLLSDRQVASLFTDPDLAGPEAECLRILNSLYTNLNQAQGAIAPMLPCAERLQAVKSLEELTALIREDGWMYGNAFYEDALNTGDRQFGKCYITLFDAPPFDYLPMDETTFEAPGLDVEAAKQKLLRLGWNEDELPQLIDRIILYTESFDWDQASATEAETDLLNRADSQMLSANDIRGFSAPLYELLKSRGLTKEGAEDEPVYKIQSENLKQFKLFWQEENLETIKAMLALSMYNGVKEVLPDDAAADSLAALKYNLPEALWEQGYARNFVRQERVDLYRELVERYKDALRARVERNDWISEATKQEVYRKIDHLVASEILYPYGEIDCIPLLEKLRSCDHFTEAYAWCSWFRHQCNLYFAGRDYAAGNRFGLTGGKIDTAYAEGRYMADDNAFYLGGASLCDYTLVMTSTETILGTFGAHLSHEFSHAFDPYCVQFNADFTGSLFATDEDREIYEQKAAAIAEQVSSIEVFDGVYSNGERQIGEIVADLTGMSLTLDMAKEMENFDYDAYFRAYAYFYCSYQPSREAASPESARAIHPYSYLRINFAVQHFEEFYETYPSVTEGTPMYLAPEDRILIW